MEMILSLWKKLSSVLLKVTVDSGDITLHRCYHHVTRIDDSIIEVSTHSPHNAFRVLILQVLIDTTSSSCCCIGDC